MTARLAVCAALGIEARALARGGLHVTRTGMGPRRTLAAAARLPTFDALAMAGFAGALDDRLRPGDLLVATEVRVGDRTLRCRSAELLASRLARGGGRVRLGPLVSTDHLVSGAERRALAATGALAVDMESGFLAAVSGTRPWAVVRAIVDTSDRPLLHPSTIGGALAARRRLREVGPALTDWAAALGPRRVLLPSPRSFCAGVERAIEVVERALDRYGAPVYVRKQIVHNTHVVDGLRRRGAVFVEELDEVPPGAVVVFSAHGVAPAVREQAGRAGLRVIDATCPLVAKVHAEARRLAARGDLVALIGHAGHEETEGTLGEAPDSTVLVETVEDVANLPAGRRVSYLMQTTLAADEAGRVADAIRRRFPDAQGPRSADICYATTNRQRAVCEVTGEADLVLVVGSANSSNSRRLVEVAEREGTPALLVDGPADIPLDRLAGVGTVGLTAGASAPPALVDAVVEALRGLGPVRVEERSVVTETVEFGLPKEVRP
ncbi:4-hydroxy-3-methylbut-2-enyl diphosphate reductase [Thermomonospora echinospora]|uniref:4-hydroxy-3-methylbut-2-enyl diphosphate reductase n=1 Tax=Thermomonospora echinospora TaxID=1992 RepID=A0A1H5ZWU8_9ACTN|nr:4-hydroxy-3-methylbut-2-enyl diphosphate reductase [Thermomonospora echinospora]SEG40978.1 4-hydroxy-3-methylbut-2-enyl diphosphate reductase [Thermomonospora echinospora]